MDTTGRGAARADGPVMCGRCGQPRLHGDEASAYFGVCPECGRPGLCRNVGRAHWLACDEHRIAWCIGSNLFSGWREEDEGVWAKNADLLRGYRTVDCAETMACACDDAWPGVRAVRVETAGPLPRWLSAAVEQATHDAGPGEAPVVVLDEGGQEATARRLVVVELAVWTALTRAEGGGDG